MFHKFLFWYATKPLKNSRIPIYTALLVTANHHFHSPISFLVHFFVAINWTWQNLAGPGIDTIMTWIISHVVFNKRETICGVLYHRQSYS